jgi:hypothetical protein
VRTDKWSRKESNCVDIKEVRNHNGDGMNRPANLYAIHAGGIDFWWYNTEIMLAKQMYGENTELSRSLYHHVTKSLAETLYLTATVRAVDKAPRGTSFIGTAPLGLL